MKKVLLIEDDSATRVYVSCLLRERNASYKAVESGSYGIEFALNEAPDLVITDIRLVVMDGLDVVRMLRKTGYRGTILTMTSMPAAEYRERALAAGADHFVNKQPSRELEGLLDRLLGAPAAGGGQDL